MSLCVIDGKQCQCQPGEGTFCEKACARLVSLESELDTMNLAVGYFHEENDRFITRIAELERALGNCRTLAMRRLHKGAVEKADWDNIVRFCTEAGCGPSPLRADS